MSAVVSQTLMPELSAVGHEEINGRDLFVIDAASPGDVAPTLSLPSKYFACLLAWDAASTDDQDISILARALLVSECVYIRCWGSDCERVHDVFDAEEAGLRPDGPFALSTWHNGESLADVLWQVLFCTWPDDAYWDGCRSTVFVSVGAAAWAVEARDAFLDPAAFSARQLGEELG